MKLPSFRYHPDPMQSGSVVESAEKCESCGKKRGYLYDGPIYSEEEVEAVCPWCIADGSAHEKFEATFVDLEAFDDGAEDAAMEEISERTPGFSSWQAEKWPSCCGEPAAFLGPAGNKEIREQYAQAEEGLMSYIVYELGITGGAASRMLATLQKDESPTAFVFRCVQCGRQLGYVDQL